ncbi:MAG: thiolase family protein, partial [Xanthobacteraceae bacterium]
MGNHRNKAAIIGIGATNFGALYSQKRPCSAYELAGEAFKLALDDCGIDKAEIDGAICVRLPSYQRVA